RASLVPTKKGRPRGDGPEGSGAVPAGGHHIRPDAAGRSATEAVGLALVDLGRRADQDRPGQVIGRARHRGDEDALGRGGASSEASQERAGEDDRGPALHSAAGTVAVGGAGTGSIGAGAASVGAGAASASLAVSAAFSASWRS